jgi:hypothetical protein
MAMVSSAQLRSRVACSGEWSLPQVAGRFAEISGSEATAVLTLAFGLVRDAQGRGEPVAWATATESSFYPPDTAQLGVDLAALVVVRVPKADAIARAGEKLLRSGGFGLVVLDLGLADIPTFALFPQTVMGIGNGFGFKPPDPSHRPTDGAHWGGHLGSCHFTTLLPTLLISALLRTPCSSLRLAVPAYWGSSRMAELCLLIGLCLIVGALLLDRRSRG